jgi:tRNA pseudouridine32 synthase/23S rRNA pseudouridine746 synthase/23S rRNA pseudouridine1911/1915/1917 synthase
MMLHARRVIVPISKNKEPVVVEAPPPEAMAALLLEMGVEF